MITKISYRQVPYYYEKLTLLIELIVINIHDSTPFEKKKN